MFKRLIILLTIVIPFTAVQAEDLFNFREVDRKSYNLELAGQWEELAEYGELAISKGFDYYYLRLRVGVAHYELRKYLYAIPHFKKALLFNPASEIASEYLHYCYLFTGKEMQAGDVYERASDKLKARIDNQTDNNFKFLNLETGPIISDQTRKIRDIDIDGTAPELKPGLTARVRIILDELEDVLSVPLSVVYEIDGQPVVFPVRRSKPHAVYLGPRNEGYVVVERGLEYGMRLTWAPPEADIFPLGASDERQRIDALAQTVRESFDVFEERGILYDYIESEDTIKSSDSSIDLDNLPAAIRNRLKNREADDGSSEPKLEVGSPGRRKKEGTFRVSPSMMKRLEKKPEDVSSSESKE